MCVIFWFLPLFVAGIHAQVEIAGTFRSDYGFSVTVDYLGSSYVVGYTYGHLDGQTNNGGSDIALMKYLADGTKLWTRLSGSLYDDLGFGVSADNTGSIYVTGHANGALDSQYHAGGSDIVLLKYAWDGTKVWTRLSGTSDHDYAYGVSTDSAGNIYITGFTKGALDGQYNAGKEDIFLMKYYSDGTKAWTRLTGDFYVDRGYGVCTDAIGNIYVTGHAYGPLDGTSETSYEGRVILMKYAADGSKAWTKQIGPGAGERRNFGHGVYVDNLGNIYITGATEDSFDDQTKTTFRDMFLIKYSEAGVKIWARHYSLSDVGNAYSYGNKVVADSFGNTYVIGHSQAVEHGSHYYSFLVKFNPDGTEAWVQLSDASHVSAGHGVSLDPSGNIYITGQISGSEYDDIFLSKYRPDGTKEWTKLSGSYTSDGVEFAVTKQDNSNVKGLVEVILQYPCHMDKLINLYEVMVYRYDGTRIVTGMTAHMTSTWYPHESSRCIDGYLDSFCSTSGYCDIGGQWLRINLPIPGSEVGRVAVYNRGYLECFGCIYRILGATVNVYEDGNVLSDPLWSRPIDSAQRVYVFEVQTPYSVIQAPITPTYAPSQPHSAIHRMKRCNNRTAFTATH
jgi:hypothetical protein